LVGLAVPDA
jgi:hypothetical protein